MTAYESEERIEYETLKDWALSGYFDFCRDRGIVMHMSHLEVLGYVSYDFECGFKRPIEDLMWRVILLVLSGGWHAEWERNARNGIAGDLARYGLDNLLVSVPEDEAHSFRHDLHILKLI